MVPKLPAEKWHFGVICGNLFISVSSGTSKTSESSRCFSRERFFVRIKGGSVDEEWATFDAVKTGKFLALSRMCLNIVSSDMILQSSSSDSLAALPTAIQGRSGALLGKILKKIKKKMECI